MDFSTTDELIKFLDNLNTRTADLCAAPSTVPPRDAKREEKTVCYRVGKKSS
jgi:hypothetical protein